MQKCKHRPLDNGTPWGALRLVPLGHFHAFMALAVEWQLLAPTCDSLKNVLQPACMMSGRLRKSLYDYHFVFLTLLLWKLGSNRWHCGSFKVDQKSAIPYWYWDNNSTPAMIRFIAMHSSKQHTATPATPSPDESSTFKKPGHNLCAGSSTWLNGSHCGQRSSNSNRQPREVTPNGAAMHQISVGCKRPGAFPSSSLSGIQVLGSQPNLLSSQIQQVFWCRQVTYLFFQPEGGKCNSPKTLLTCDKSLTSHIKSIFILLLLNYINWRPFWSVPMLRVGGACAKVGIQRPLVMHAATKRQSPEASPSFKRRQQINDLGCWWLFNTSERLLSWIN